LHRRRTVRLNGHVARRVAGPVERILWDDELAGFGLRIQPTGHKTWIVKYEQHGRQIKVTLGVVGDLAAEAARGQARALLAKVATKGLPRPAVQRTAPTFEAYVEPFWADYARHWKPLTQTTNRRIIERELKPAFGATTLDRIKRSDVMRWRDDLSDRPGVFNRALPVLAGMLAYAEQLGHRPSGSNPCRRTPRYRRVPQERFLSAAEYRRLGAVLASLAVDEPAAVTVIRLLLLTGARVSEILTLRWDSLQPPRLHLPDSKTGPKFVYLGANATVLLEAIPRSDDSPWVFPARVGEGPLSTIYPQWAKIRRAAAIPDVRLHDLRHSFASVAINAGVSLMLIGRLLGHAQPETTARYAHLEDRSIGDAATRVSRSLGHALGVSI
jgi:integrase